MTTPVYSVPIDKVTTAVLELLNSTGRAVYDGAYAGDPTKPVYPYGVLYSLPGGASDSFPDLGYRRRAVTLAYQVSAVSNLRNQCEATVQRFRDRLLARDTDGWVYGLAVPLGWVCVDRAPDPDMPGVDRSGDPPRAVYSSPFRFHLTISPS